MKIKLMLCALTAIAFVGCGAGDETPAKQPETPSGGLNPYLPSELALPSIISDNMVLQQNSQARIWGKAIPGSQITIQTSWNEKPFTELTGNDGIWIVPVQTPAASQTAHTMTIKDSQRTTKTIQNILIGEVWLCSGQSNMEMPMRGFGSTSTGNYQPVKDADTELASANFPSFRYFKVSYPDLNASSQGLQFDTRGGSWVACTPTSAREYSAIAFFFGRKLHQDKQVPVGMIGCSYGGTPIAAWKQNDGQPVAAEKGAPGILYNGMIWPVHRYTLRGILWYQGESDLSNANYGNDLQEMAADWREDWGDTQHEIPFYYVQVAPYGYKDNLSAAKMMEVQLNTMARIPNSGVVATSDVGDQKLQHYPDKQVPAERLLLWAYRDIYKIGNTDPQSPTYKSMEVKEGKAIVTFDHAERLSCAAANIPYVQIAGADKTFHSATAVVGPNANQITVSSPEVATPVAVRYCFTSWHVGQLYNQDGLPAYPFRTDKW